MAARCKTNTAREAARWRRLQLWRAGVGKQAGRSPGSGAAVSTIAVGSLNSLGDSFLGARGLIGSSAGMIHRDCARPPALQSPSASRHFTYTSRWLAAQCPPAPSCLRGGRWQLAAPLVAAWWCRQQTARCGCRVGAGGRAWRDRASRSSVGKDGQPLLSHPPVCVHPACVQAAPPPSTWMASLQAVSDPAACGR